MKKAKIALCLVLPILMLFSLWGCAQQPAQAPENSQTQATSGQAETPAGASEKIRVALVLPGSLNDGGWNANAYAGLMSLQGKGYEVAFTENVAISAIEEALNNYASKGYDLIVGHGFEFGEPTLRVAPQYPEVHFFVSGKVPDGVDVNALPANVGFMDMKEYEAAYLAGIVAGGMTKSNVIGYIAGLEIPSQLSNMAGFVKGVASINPNAKVYGVVTGSFEDPAKGQEAANAQIDMGADIICHSADSTGMGAIQAAAEKGVYIVGYGSDQNDIQPDLVLTSFITKNSEVIEMQVARIEQGTFGGLWTPGIADGICYIAPYHGLEGVIPANVKAAVEDATAKIISGELVVPAIYERIDEKIG
ncbi:MAG: BMP family protein [Bacillota bacterium]